MKNPVIVLFVLLAWFSISTCKKGGNSQDQPTKPADTTKTQPRPAISISEAPVTILLPNNCEQQFTITNSGPRGTTLNYTVKDDGALQGFLDFNNPSGSLAAGASAIINVEVKPALDYDQSLIGAALVLDVYTPNASNLTKISVPVNVKSTLSQEPLFIGTWSGTWTGVTNSSPTGAQGIAVSGTWTLDLKTVDTVNNTFTGSLTWVGTDAYWTTATASNGYKTLISEAINQVTALDASNTAFTTWMPPDGCDQTVLLLEMNTNFLTGTAIGYGPAIEAVFDIGSKTVTFQPQDFWSFPASGNESSGSISGSKQ